MRKIRKSKEQTLSADVIKKRFLIGGISALVLLLILIVLIFFENRGGNIRVHNNTDLNLDYVNVYYVYSEGFVFEDDLLEVPNIQPNNTYVKSMKPVKLRGYEATLTVRFRLQGQEEMFVDAGYFNDRFSGNIDITFDQSEEGNIMLNVKATHSLLKSNSISCNDDFKISFTEGYID